MTDYIALTELRAYLHDGSVLDSGPAAAAVTAASRMVDTICGRYFSQDSTVSARYFWPDSSGSVCIDDLSTTTGLLVEVDTAGDGTWSQSWTITTDFYLEPINQTQDGISGWPYTSIQATLGNKYFPTRTHYSYLRPTVKVTGKWGWAAVPDPVKQATFVIAAQLYKLGDAPFGNAGFGEFGVMRVREIPMVNQLLGPFSKTAGVVVA